MNKMVENDQSQPSDQNAGEERMSEAAVLKYMQHLFDAAKLLAQVPTEGNDEEMDDIEKIDVTIQGGDWYLDQIARALLASCHLSTITSSTKNLPLIRSESNLKEENMDDEKEHRMSATEYQYRRVDYLRLLLRAMAPVAIDIAAYVCSIAKSYDQNKIDFNMQICLPCFVLFSTWLPVAPQITPLVSELFQLEFFECPFLLCKDVCEESRWIVAEAANHIFSFYCSKRKDRSTIMKWWNWSPVFRWNCEYNDTDGMQIDKNETPYSVVPFDLPKAIKWHSVRVAAFVLNLASGAKPRYFKKHGVENEQVQWLIHPWAVDQEEYITQKLHMNKKCRTWEEDATFPCPETSSVRAFLPLHPYLVEIGDGIVFVKHGAIHDEKRVGDSNSTKPEKDAHKLVCTTTTARNLSLIGAAMSSDPFPMPLLICGPNGSGKSSLIREVARMISTSKQYDDQLLEIHVDEETDTKTLVGSYNVTDIPGEFEWRPGALTHAVRTGKWVLLEDIDTVSHEIQASLVQMLKDRILPLGNGKTERCHPDFRIFGTMTVDKYQVGRRAAGARGRRPLNPSLWQYVYVEPLPLIELKVIATKLYPSLPLSVVQSVLEVFSVLDRSGREHDMNENESTHPKIMIGKNASVRDLFKVFSRVSNTIPFEDGSVYATESQRTLCLAECFDVFAAACPDKEIRRHFIQHIASPCWGITAKLAMSYTETRSAPVTIHPTFTEVGRVKIPVSENNSNSRVQSNHFAQTNYALRLMESIGACVRENEPALLVGETGTGKTTLIQELAKLSGAEMIVQNLSLQTDSADLLGGYRPLEIQYVARHLYQEFVNLFTGSFSRKQNADFLEFASSALKQEKWKKLSQCFVRASKLGLAKVKERINTLQGKSQLEKWISFKDASDRFEQQRMACDTGLAFVFAEGALVDAIRKGKWVLLDEINLASSETLQRICGLLDDASSSLTLTERGDAVAIERHPSFRLFAAMNPATDVGKKDLNPNIRARFTELFVDELVEPGELRLVASRYISGVLPASERPPEHTDIVASVVDLYKQCRELADRVLVDGSGQKPRYTMRTLSRALLAAKNFVILQKQPLERALHEGFELTFQGPLDEKSLKTVKKTIQKALGGKTDKSEVDHPGRRPGSARDYVLIKPFWIDAGPLELIDWSEQSSSSGLTRFILTPTTSFNLRRLARAIASGPWPILLEGPTSAGKTTLVEYMAARCGHKIIRINNHEHTDVQEYTGAFATDESGSLSFQDGMLVRALKLGHWVILDELNLAPSDVLEALNRLLDANQELYIPEINESIKPHPRFRLFATQNPSGAYGGRKPLSRAFRNRFIEIHVDNIPSKEMVSILELRCGCPPTHARILVEIMDALRKRRSKSGVFLGKDGFITPRDLLRWAERGASSKIELAREGFMLLAERLRTNDEKECVQEEIEKHLKVKIDPNAFYYGKSSEARHLLDEVHSLKTNDDLSTCFSASIAPTKSLLRLVTLVLRAVKQREPILLVGDTGCGKTVSVQLLSLALKSRLHIINCHQTTETSDLIGGLRPVRGRSTVAFTMLHLVKDLISVWPDSSIFDRICKPKFLESPSRSTLPDDAVEIMASFSRSLWEVHRETESNERKNKRQKLEDSIQCGTQNDILSLTSIMERIESLFVKYNSLFEWSDGPLVKAMKTGDMILLDEISLAEDAVLERLNSVLEPSKTIVLAEKGGNIDGCSNIITAHKEFQLFATMNPGGDFGKRELSPALRSRFTEIWVPPVTDVSDIGLVLEYTLSSSSVRIKERMLEYVDWFNQKVCGEPGTPCSELSLSLRDILAWARFVANAHSSNKDLVEWDAYVHGARLMHLDGLGLGTGLAAADAESTRQRAEVFLLAQVTQEGHPCRQKESVEFSLIDGRFGARPFWIQAGILGTKKHGFNFAAPTTANNVLRVLRAMQLQKPVLLEGSPGVGKTATVSALASASGHNLVRINLSEQTDISDLFGSDLPVPEGESTVFRWCDGVLLTAIKNGDWVLLDELNLASQSVLEGLNSCLDHRASVYIPELGKTFECPSTFRVFAAQNPLSQGGGRKGLPKSFLNRFTKVYVDALSVSDMQLIIESKFPKRKDADKLVKFNCELHAEVVDRGNFGHAGSPWEFNLRDIFRWCQLLEEKEEEQNASVIRYRCCRDLYFQRFRSRSDREKVKMIYNETFGVNQDKDRISSSFFFLSGDKVTIGDAVLPRFHGNNPANKDDGRTGFFVRLSLHEPMEAVARCVEMSWPCLLVGNSKTGKDSIVRNLADLCNSKLFEIPLSSSSDVSELVGCFEQVDQHDNLHTVVQSLSDAATELLAFDNHTEDDEALNELILSLKKIPKIGKAPVEEILKHSIDLLGMLNKRTEIIESSNPDRKVPWVKDVINKLETMQQDQNHLANHFAWKDGILVQAMTEGHWLLLKNANLCPSSVLDRLNPVMEPDGYLLLAESGAGNDSSSSRHREVKCHPNFRIFLSMDPDNGEISRAMRNRCVEISLLRRSWESSVEFVDSLDSLWGAGIRASNLASRLISSQNTSRHVGNDGIDASSNTGCSIGVLGTVASSLILRGIGANRTLSLLSDLFPVKCQDKDLNSSNETQKKLLGYDFGPLVPSSSVRENWCQNPLFSVDHWKSRCLRMFFGTDEQNFPLSRLTLGYSQLCDMSDTCKIKPEEFKLFFPYMREKDVLPDLQNYMLLLFVLDNERKQSYRLNEYFDRLGGDLKRSLNFTIDYLDRIRKSQAFSTGISHLERFSNDLPHLSQRSPQLLKELLWHENRLEVNGIQDNIKEKSVLKFSFLISEGRVDKATIVCPLTPVLFPFLKEIDGWIDAVLSSKHLFDKKDAMLEVYFDLFVSVRDELWNLLDDIPFCYQKSSFLLFDEAELIIIWKRFRKNFDSLKKITETFHDAGPKERERRVRYFMDIIENVLFEAENENELIGTSLLKHSITPIVPRAAEDWESLSSLRRISKTCTIERTAGNQSVGILNLPELMDTRHPALFIDEKLRRDILGAVCTLHLISTDEINMGKKIALKDKSYHLVEIISHELRKETDTFNLKVDSIRIDTNIETVENQFGVDELESLMSKTSFVRANRSELSEKMLLRFSELQLAPSVEYWCEQREKILIRELCQMLCNKTNETLQRDLRLLNPSIHKLLDVALHKTCWEYVELRPYQTLLWITESTGVDENEIRRVVASLLPTIFANAARRCWTGCLSLSQRLSKNLEMPSLLTKEFPDDDDLKRRNLAIISSDSINVLEDVPSATIFSLVSDTMKAFSSSPHPSFTLSTMENFRTRKTQLGKASGLLASLDVGVGLWQPPFEIFYLFLDILRSLEGSFPDSSKNDLMRTTEVPEMFFSLEVSTFRTLLKTSENVLFVSFVDSVAVPLFDCLKRLWRNDSGSSKSTEDLALSKIYIGLLRFHLLIPDSPLDPGREPIAKIKLIDRRLSIMGFQLSALQLESLFLTGEFLPEDENIKFRILKGKDLLIRRHEQEGKVIHRCTSSPPYYELFKECKDFSRSIMKQDSILSMVKMLLNPVGQSNEDVAERERQWQQTTEAFCDRFSSRFEHYEDVVSPILSAIGFVKEGFNIIVSHQAMADPINSHILETIEISAAFPLPDLSKSIGRLVTSFRSIDVQSKLHLLYRRSLALGVLARLLVKKNTTGISSALVDMAHQTFTGLIEKAVDPMNSDTPLDIDAAEKDFREQFPNHRQEFEALVEAETQEDSAQPEDPDAQIESILENGPLSIEEIELLFFLYRDIFEPKQRSCADFDRLRMFRLCYEASCKGVDVLRMRKSSLRFNGAVLSGHIMALSLCTPFQNGGLEELFHKSLSSDYLSDFHRDPNPKIALEASRAMDDLIGRTAQLLTAFPGNSVLTAIAKVAERVQKLDIFSTSLGRFMTGLEVILKHAQDWEQHASERVKLGTAFTEVSIVVSSWRKLELKSWPNLIIARERKYKQRARKHWSRIYLIIRNLTNLLREKCVDSSCGHMNATTRRWVWKGMVKDVENIVEFAEGVPADLFDTLKALDTFCLTSSLGEFEERVNILDAFANQIEQESLLSAYNPELRKTSSSLRSMCSYYRQFWPTFDKKLTELRKPFETRLQQEVKLAKWDEQTYYAMAQSSERNHRKLMKILREYDEVLDQSVSALIESDMCKGVRETPTSTAEASPSIPSANMLFPIYTKDQLASNPESKNVFEKLTRSWTNTAILDLPSVSPLTKLEKYSRKMENLHFKDFTKSKSYAALGASEANNLSESIFERIELLRSDKTTRPMKERALVELFRELKRHGYATTKRSIPTELRDMYELFQLPSPTSSDSAAAPSLVSPLLQSSESYYQRSLVESHRLRAEVNMLGSKHMTSKQLLLMTTFTEHGLLLNIQQRSLLSSLLSCRDRLSKLMQEIPAIEEDLPPSQRMLRSLLVSHERDYAMALESTKQLMLLIKATEKMLAEDGKSWAQDSLSKLESFLSKLDQPLDSQMFLVHQNHVDRLKNRHAILSAGADHIVECQRDCVRLECLPLASFATTLSNVKKAIESSACFCVDFGSNGNLNGTKVDNYVEQSEKCVHAALLAVQALARDRKKNLDDGEDDFSGVWDCHRRATRNWTSLNFSKMVASFESLLCCLQTLYDAGIRDEDRRKCCLGLTLDVRTLYDRASVIIDSGLHDYVAFHRSSVKLNYVLLRIFRVLCAKGFCSEKASDDDAEGDDHDASGMTFDDNDGTGMGEGEGSRDVTDQIENEEQLLGLKNEGDEDNPNTEKNESKQLDEEEAEKGMEMEGDFEGELFDVPDKAQEEDKDKEDEGEELEREMGEDGSPNEEVVDEKMWDASDDENDNISAEEKFEENNAMKGAAASDEMVTRDDDTEPRNKEAETDKQAESDGNKEQEESKLEESDGEDKVNDDFEDNYEESHGVDVRDENQNPKEDDTPDQMDIDDNLDLEDTSAKGDDNSEEGDDLDPDEKIDMNELELDNAKEEDQKSDDEAQEETENNAATSGLELDENEDAENPSEEKEPPRAQKAKDKESHRGLGVSDEDGNDAVENKTEEDAEGKGETEETAEGDGTGQSEIEPSGEGGMSSGGKRGENQSDSANQNTERHEADTMPNPLKNPGDASKFWHRKLNIIKSQNDVDDKMDTGEQDQDVDTKNAEGDFEYDQGEKSEIQALGEAEAEDAIRLDENEESKQAEPADSKASEKPQDESNAKTQSERRAARSKTQVQNEELEDEEPNDMTLEEEDEVRDTISEEEIPEESDEDNNPDDLPPGNRIVADLAQLNVGDDTKPIYNQTKIVEEEYRDQISNADALEARKRWAVIQSETQNLSRRLCEKLRLVMEPLVATKLRGDYRTGKRINMKRVIGYIASGYRKDKIWLRRTKPAKRNYRVLVAVDDSESMLKSGAGNMALKAMATLATGMSQLEIGEIGIASFGNEMNLVHPFHQPFTSESGGNVVQSFQFDQQRTRTSLCVESALMALDTPGEHASMQLVFMISDGRIERDSRETLRRLIREMVERNILLVMIIVEGDNHKDRIINMKEVTFEKGKPSVKQFIEDYPFPYYIILEDMHTLPEVLGDALKQWFEMLARLQSNQS